MTEIITSSGSPLHPFERALQQAQMSRETRQKQEIPKKKKGVTEDADKEPAWATALFDRMGQSLDRMGQSLDRMGQSLDRTIGGHYETRFPITVYGSPINSHRSISYDKSDGTGWYNHLQRDRAQCGKAGVKYRFWR